MMNERLLDSVGYLTWLIIGIPSVVWGVQHHMLGTPRGVAWMIVCWYGAARRAYAILWRGRAPVAQLDRARTF